MIELSGETPPGQGDKHDPLSHNAHPTIMYHKSRKRRSEAQRRHDKLLHKSRHDPAAYREATLEAMSKTAEEYKERARVAEANTERDKKALSQVQDQIIRLRGELSSKNSAINELLQAIDDKEKEIQEFDAFFSELADRIYLLHRDIHQLTVGI